MVFVQNGKLLKLVPAGVPCTWAKTLCISAHGYLRCDLRATALRNRPKLCNAPTGEVYFHI